MLIATLLMIAKTWKQAQCSLTDEWIDKTWYIILFNHRKEGNSSICINTNEFEGIILIAVNQTKTNTIWSHFYRYLAKKANGNRVNAAKGMGARELGEADQRAQTSRDKMNRFWGPNIQHGDHSQQ